MPLVLADRVKELTTSTGTGTITLAGAVTGYQSFSVVGNGNTTHYVIAGGSQWEVGIGTYTSSGTTLSRDSVLASSNSGLLVNFSAGTKDVFCTYPAGKSVNTDQYQVNKNRLSNGAMVVDQRGAAVTVTGGHPVDRWVSVFLTSGALSYAQATQAPVGFTKSVGVTATTGDGSIAATEFAGVQQRIEGYDIADLGFGTVNAKTVTASFWVRSPATGTHCFILGNSPTVTRSYVAEYTVNSANTWEYKTITIPGDTSGTWVTDNQSGMVARFGLAVGSNFQQAAGSWGTVNSFGSANQVNVIATTNNVFYVTGVQLEVGSVATNFEYRHYEKELSLCQRYYYRIYADTIGQPFGTGYNSSTTQTEGVVIFPVPMRTGSSALDQTGTAADYRIITGAGTANCSSVPIFVNATRYLARVRFTVASGLTTGQGALIATGGSSYLGFSAEM
jgi:hypothetical protein